jgi:signal transduction histidine kinase
VTERGWVGPASFVVLLLLLVATVGGVLVTRSQLQRRLEVLAASAAATVRHDVQLTFQRDVAAALGLARSLPEPLTSAAGDWDAAVTEVARAGVFSTLAAVNLLVVTSDVELEATIDELPAETRAKLDLRLSDGPRHAVGVATWPEGPNRPVLGYDVLAIPGAAAAVETVLASGTVTATRPIRVVQEVDEQRSTVVYVPVVDGERVAGMVSLVVRAGPLLEDSVSRLPTGIAVTWADVTPGVPEADALLAAVGDADPDGAVAREELTDAGRTSAFEVTLPASALGAAERGVPLLVGALGTVLSLGLLVTTTAWRRTATRADRIAEQRTAALAAATTELEAANRDLVELDRLKDRMLRTVSHDLRSPLAVIGGVTQLLLDRPDLPSEKQADLLRRVRRQASRLRGLIDELLVAAQVRSGALTADRRPVDLLPLIETVISDLGVGTLSDVDDEVPRVLADRVHVERILHNLLTNAANHGRLPIEVSLSRGEGDLVEVQVRRPRRRDPRRAARAGLHRVRAHRGRRAGVRPRAGDRDRARHGERWEVDLPRAGWTRCLLRARAAADRSLASPSPEVTRGPGERRGSGRRGARAAARARRRGAEPARLPEAVRVVRGRRPLGDGRVVPFPRLR